MYVCIYIYAGSYQYYQHYQSYYHIKLYLDNPRIVKMEFPMYSFAISKLRLGQLGC